MNLTNEVIHLTPVDFKWITERLFHHNCQDQYENLTRWDEGANYMFAGIGHFTWYPRDTKKIFAETFPRMLDFLEESGATLPKWLSESRFRGCPWNSRDEFLLERKGAVLSGLRKFLQDTVKLQVGYIVSNAQTAIERISSTRPASDQQEFIDKINLLLQSPQGFYPLIDYVSFKGGGCSPEERYQGMGWGLLQVLTEMKMPGSPSLAKRSFAEAAVRILERRVANAPVERHEEKWSPVWKKRVQSYLE